MHLVCQNSLFAYFLALACASAPGPGATAQSVTHDNTRDQFYAMEEWNPIESSNEMIIYRDARYLGGMRAMKRHVAESIELPKHVASHNLQGKVLVQFVVTREGNVEDAEVLRSVHPAVDTAILNAVKTLSLWEPAVRNGMPIESTVVVPIKATKQ